MHASKFVARGSQLCGSGRGLTTAERDGPTLWQFLKVSTQDDETSSGTSTTAANSHVPSQLSKPLQHVQTSTIAPRNQPCSPAAAMSRNPVASGSRPLHLRTSMQASSTLQPQSQHLHHPQLPNQLSQLRHLSWRNHLPSTETIRGYFESPSRQVTNLLIAINLATYLVAKYDSTLVYSMIGVSYAIARGEWYRLLTAGFLHLGFLHLLSNLLSIHWLGPPLESATGRPRFAVIFLASVVAGNWLQASMGPMVGSFMGASGGVSGILGAYLVYRLRNRNFISWDSGDTSWVAQIMGLNALVWLSSGGGIGHWAHLGGLLAGSATCWLIGPRYRWRNGGVEDVPLLSFRKNRR